MHFVMVRLYRWNQFISVSFAHLIVSRAMNFVNAQAKYVPPGLKRCSCLQRTRYSFERFVTQRRLGTNSHEVFMLAFFTLGCEA